MRLIPICLIWLTMAACCNNNVRRAGDERAVEVCEDRSAANDAAEIYSLIIRTHYQGYDVLCDSLPPVVVKEMLDSSWLAHIFKESFYELQLLNSGKYFLSPIFDPESIHNEDEADVVGLRDGLIDVLTNPKNVASDMALTGLSFKILTDEVSRSFEGELFGMWWTEFYKRFPDSKGYFAFSDVAFSDSGNYAVVYWQHSQGMLSGVGYLELFHKVGLEWESVKSQMLWIS